MTASEPAGPATFHVVCHDCPHERLVADERTAADVAGAHATETGHAVEFDRVS